MKRFLLFLFLFSHTAIFAQVKFARVFSDHVVLQRQKPVPVWGWGKAGEKVKVTLAGKSIETKTDKSGKWLVKFPPMEAGGPHNLTVSAKSGNASVADVLIGEVWLCSGQSNMEWPVRAAMNFEEEKKNAEYPQIRHFRVDHQVSLQPEKDLNAGEWQLANSENVGGFSAIGFFFAREIYQKLQIPVGILHSSWGGSQIEGWLSKEAMQEDEELKDYVATMPKTWQEADVMMDAKLRKQLFKNAAFIPSAADEQKYISGNADFSNWQKAGDPVGQWDWKGLMGFRGNGYLAKEIEIDQAVAGKPTILSLPENDSPNQIYINGKLVYEGTAKGVRKIDIPANSWKSGKNQLVIKNGNMVANAWFGPGWLGSPADLYLAEGDNRIAISKDWYLMPAFAEKHEYAHLMNNVGTSIYNAMIVPVTGFAIRGTLWYQGETNAPRAYQYRRLFPLMINDWRKLWNDEFSFYWVQLSSFGKENDSNEGSAWAELREAQDMTLSLPKTGMAVSIDVGNPKDIHPTNKQTVAHRLATNALKQDYGQNIAYASPILDSVSLGDGNATVTFKNAENGLMTSDKYGYIKGFEIAGKDGVFHFAQAKINGNKVIVSYPMEGKPAAVRYGWSDAPEDANLFSKDGFPVSPFRTDDWKGKTEGVRFE